MKYVLKAGEIVEQRLEAYLVMGCNGFETEEGFTICLGISNKIIDLTTMPENTYKELLVFFDDACDLFSAPINDYNKCVNILSLLYKNYDAFDKKMLHNVQSYFRLHKQCGIWIALIMKEDFDERF